MRAIAKLRRSQNFDEASVPWRANTVQIARMGVTQIARMGVTQIARAFPVFA